MSKRYVVLPTPCADNGGWQVWDIVGARMAAARPDRATAEYVADKCNESVAVPLGELLALRELVDGFHAVKQIRAHAAEENQATKREAARILARLLLPL